MDIEEFLPEDDGSETDFDGNGYRFESEYSEEIYKLWGGWLKIVP